MLGSVKSYKVLNFVKQISITGHTHTYFMESLTCGNHSCSTGGKHSLSLYRYLDTVYTVCRSYIRAVCGRRRGEWPEVEETPKGAAHETIILKCCLDCTGAHLLAGRIIKKV